MRLLNESAGISEPTYWVMCAVSDAYKALLVRQNGSMNSLALLGSQFI